MSPEAAHSPYVGANSPAYHEGKRAVPAAAVPWIVRSRARLFASQIGPDAAVLEYGCGFGWNLAGLSCRRRVGHDVALQLRPVVEDAGIEFVPDTAALPEATFDAGILHHALEHVGAPGAVLLEMKRLLRRGGRLLIAVPWESGRRYRRFNPAEPNHHLFSWNVQTLGALVTVNGFHVEQAGLRPYGYDRRAALLAVQFRLGERGFRGIRAVLRLLKPLREVVVVASNGFSRKVGVAS